MLLSCIFFTALLFTAIQVVAASEIVNEIELNTDLKDHIHSLPSIPAEGQRSDSIQFDDRVVIVTFFASWCPPCLDEFEALNHIIRQVGTENVTVVALNVFEEFDDNDEIRMSRFLQRTQPEFRVLGGNETSLELFGGINRIPTLFVFDKSGKPAFNFVHTRGADKQSVDALELLEAIRPLL